MEKSKLKNIVEAVLTASDRILSLNQLEKILTEKSVVPKKLSDSTVKNREVSAANDSENSEQPETETVSEDQTEASNSSSNEASSDINSEEDTAKNEEAAPEKISGSNNLKPLIKEVIAELQEDYAERATELKEVASGYRFQVRQEYAEHVGKLWEERPSKYSRALLETLVLIAYRQPITRGEIEAIRGVSVSSHIMKTLTEREWVRVIGHRDVPGKPAIYGSTKEFLDYFNLKSLDELPSLSEIKDLDQIAPELALGEVAAELVAENADKTDDSDTAGSIETDQSSEESIEVVEGSDEEVSAESPIDNTSEATDEISMEDSSESSENSHEPIESSAEIEESEQSDNDDAATSQENESDNAELS